MKTNIGQTENQNYANPIYKSDCLLGFSDRVSARGGSVSSKVIAAQYNWPRNSELNALYNEAFQRIWKFTRVRQENDEPVAYEISNFNFNFTNRPEPGNSIYMQLRLEGESPAKCLERIEVRCAPLFICRALNQPENTAMLYIERRVFNRSGRQLEYTQGWYLQAIEVELSAQF